MTVSLPTRDATGADNDALLALTAACPMEGDIGLCLQRRPDTRATEADVGGMAQLWRG